MIIENIDILIPKLEETISIEGTLRYSDGKPAAEEWVRFKVTQADNKADGDVDEQTDSAGRFTPRVLKGLTGELAGDDWLFKELVDIKDFNLPLLDEPMSPMMGQYTHQDTKDWSAKIASFDAFVFVTPEYNHATSGALKNAIDFLYHDGSTRRPALSPTAAPPACGRWRTCDW